MWATTSLWKTILSEVLTSSNLNITIFFFFTKIRHDFLTNEFARKKLTCGGVQVASVPTLRIFSSLFFFDRRYPSLYIISSSDSFCSVSFSPAAYKIHRIIIIIILIQRSGRAKLLRVGGYRENRVGGKTSYASRWLMRRRIREFSRRPPPLWQ